MNPFFITTACMLIVSTCTLVNNVEAAERHHDGEIQTLKQQLKQTQALLLIMQQRLEALEKQQAAQKAAQITASPAVNYAAQNIPSATSGSSSANAFNPEINAVLNGSYRMFSQSPSGFAISGLPTSDVAGLGSRGLGLNESELNMTSNVDNMFYSSLTVSLAPAGGANVEEAYIQTLNAPFGMTVKAGRFFSSVGYLNQFHVHHDDFIDRPLPNRAFLNTQFGDDGIQLRWLAPTDTFLELGSELYKGSSFPGGGSASRGQGTWTAFMNMGGDIGYSQSWKAGLSYLHARPIARNAFDAAGNSIGSFSGNSNLWLLNSVWKWAPNGNPVNQNVRLQSEFFYRHEQGLFGTTAPTASYLGRQFGWYAEAVYQFIPRWRVGLRHAELFANNKGAAVTAASILNNAGHRPRRDSVVAAFNNSEFSRIRLQLSRDTSQAAKADYQMALQYIMLIGAHGAHQF